MKEKSVSLSGFKTNVAGRITQAIDAVTALGFRVVVTFETLFGPVLNVIGTVVTMTFCIPVLGVLLFRLVTAFHHGISGLFLVPEALLVICGVLPEKRLRSSGSMARFAHINAAIGSTGTASPSLYINARL